MKSKEGKKMAQEFRRIGGVGCLKRELQSPTVKRRRLYTPNTGQWSGSPAHSRGNLVVTCGPTGKLAGEGLEKTVC